MNCALSFHKDVSVFYEQNSPPPPSFFLSRQRSVVNSIGTKLRQSLTTLIRNDTMVHVCGVNNYRLL